MEAVKHRVIMEERRGAEVTGITDLLIFDENEIVVETTLGLLTVHGMNLHISSLALDRGQILLEGEIHEIYYEEAGRVNQPKNTGFFAKMIHG